MLSLFRLALVKIVLENPCTNPMRTSSDFSKRKEATASQSDAVAFSHMRMVGQRGCKKKVASGDAKATF
jgi:hypothetical protein